MIASLPLSPDKSHDGFLALVPIVERHGRVVFRAMPVTDREEAIAEAVAAAFVAYRRLRARGIDPVRRFPTMMATYAVLYAKCGRHVGSRASSTDVLSKVAQRRHGFQVERLPISTRRCHEDIYGTLNGQQKQDVFEERLADNTVTPVPDQVVFRIDFPAWLQTLTARERRIIREMASNERTKDLSRRFNVSPGRISQLRREFEQGWKQFCGEQPGEFEKQGGAA